MGTFRPEELFAALTRARSDITHPNTTQAFVWLPDLRIMMLHGTIFGAGHLGVAAWKDPDYGFSIRNAEVRAACAVQIAEREGRPISALVVLSPPLRDFTQADFGLDALANEAALIRSGDCLLVPAEVFLSRTYGAQIPRLRNPTLVSS